MQIQTSCLHPHVVLFLFLLDVCLFDIDSTSDVISRWCLVIGEVLYQCAATLEYNDTGHGTPPRQS